MRVSRPRRRKRQIRITYEAAPVEKVVITGAERIQGWEKVEGTDGIWCVAIDNALFGDFNPYTTELFGDWIIYPCPCHVHLGDVYLNGHSLYEAMSLEDVKHPVMRTEGVGPDWEGVPEKVLEPENTLYQWYTEQRDGKTVIYARFGAADPNAENVEINVRGNCVRPDKLQVNYITLRGFEICQAATQWCPPTGVQSGMVDTRWSKGWVIENNHLHDAKTSAISLGKEVSTGDNEYTRYRRKPGYQMQMEAVFKALKIGWSKELVGSHLVQDNDIHDCGENGVVGHLGCVFSTIRRNRIYRIAKKYEFFGHEIAGIKLHTAIDVTIEENDFHDCALGIWLDWEAQGTRVSRNLFSDNTRDLMVEVTHGPCIVDNNIFASDYNFDNVAQGTALINNYFSGTTRRIQTMDRATPYHRPHSTDVAGVAVVYGGDDRVMNNIFVGGPMGPNGISVTGTAHYNGHPDNLAEYVKTAFDGMPEDHTVFWALKDPVYVKDNVYVKDAEHYERETPAAVTSFDPGLKIECHDGKVTVSLDVSPEMLKDLSVIRSGELGVPRITECPFEDKNGEEIVFDTGIDGVKRSATAVAGPFGALKAGLNTVTLFN